MSANFRNISKDIAAGKIAPVYLLYGEEPYFIDQVTDMLDKPGVVITAAEAAFNRALMYGADTKVGTIFNECQSFPVMAQRRLVIVKEAQKLDGKEGLKNLLPYLKNPVPSTVLALAVKDAKPGLTPTQLKGLPNSVVVMHSKRFYDRDAQSWVNGYLQDQNIQFEPAIVSILVDSLGTNPGYLQQEIDKMLIYLKAKKQTQLSRDYVFEMIDIDKNFNSFELVKALAIRDIYRSHLIIDRLSLNSKVNPPVLTIGALSRFFHHLGQALDLSLQNAGTIQKKLKVNYYQAQDIATGLNYYSRHQVERNLHLIRRADAELKGSFYTLNDSAHILKTLVLKILE